MTAATGSVAERCHWKVSLEDDTEKRHWNMTKEEVVGRFPRKMTMDDDKRAPSPPFLNTVGFSVFRPRLQLGMDSASRETGGESKGSMHNQEGRVEK